MKMEVVNENDKEYFNSHFETFYFGSYGEHSFKVYCSSDTAEALEAVGAYCKEKGYNGLLSFDSYEKLLKDCDNNKDVFDEQWFPVNGGEFYLQMPVHVDR